MKEYHKPRKRYHIIFKIVCIEIQFDRGIVDFDGITVLFWFKI